MDLKLAGIVFGSIFLAELGDKTQLATLLFAADRDADRWVVFIAAAAALILTSALAVLFGGLVARYLPLRTLHWIAGMGFIAIGAFTVWRA